MSESYWRASNAEDERLDVTLQRIRSQEDLHIIDVRQAADMRVRGLRRASDDGTGTADRHYPGPQDAMGTVAVREPVFAQLTAVENFVRQARGPVRPALLEVAAQWAQFAAYLHRDAGDPAGDRVRLAQGLEWAVEIGDKTMIASVLVQRAYGALHIGETGTVIGLCQAAQQDKTIAIGQRAYGAALEAQGHARAGDAAMAERKLGEMSELAAKLGCRPEAVPCSACGKHIVTPPIALTALTRPTYPMPR